MKELMIEVKDVSMQFRLSGDRITSLKEFVTAKLAGKLTYNEFWALKNVNFEVYKGEVFGIIGRNGSGKSTLLKVFLSLLKA